MKRSLVNFFQCINWGSLRQKLHKNIILKGLFNLDGAAGIISQPTLYVRASDIVRATLTLILPYRSTSSYEMVTSIKGIDRSPASI